MSKIIYEKTNEIIENKIDMNLFRKRSSAKTINGYLISVMKKLRDSNGVTFTKPEILELIQTIYKKNIELEETAQVRLKGWKGKSDFKIIKKPDKFIVITFRKKDQDSKPQEVKREILKSEVNEVFAIINRLDENKKIPTRKIGEKYYGKIWDEVFSDRFAHTQLNYCLRLLNEFGVIHYRGGTTILLKKNFDMQTFLK